MWSIVARAAGGPGAGGGGWEGDEAAVESVKAGEEGDVAGWCKSVVIEKFSKIRCKPVINQVERLKSLGDGAAGKGGG